MRIAEYRKGHISRTDESDDYLEWFVDRGIRTRRALESFQAGAWHGRRWGCSRRPARGMRWSPVNAVPL
ncbi:MAG: hypothetical protein MUQ27_13750, partial [Acidimicrobiia bacterium]|nr:hypothetical protein [Acidimicrobiia bacterium]